MRTKNDIESRNILKNHQSKIKRLNDHHENELNALKNKHDKNKVDLRASQQDQLHIQRVNHDNKIAIKSLENEKTYNKLQENLNEVKERVAKTKREIELNQDKEIKNRRLLHETKIEEANQANTIKISDANDAANYQLKRLREQTQAEKESLTNQSINDKSLIVAQSRDERQKEKQAYRQKHSQLTTQNAKAIFNIKRDHSRLKSAEERKNSEELVKKREIWSEELSKLDEDSSRIKSSKQEEFEKDYAVQYKKHEDLTRTLTRNKEKILKEFTDELTQKFEIGAQMHEDPFYKFGTLDVNIRENYYEDGYDIYIPVEEHEADKIKLSAQGRDIRITMERQHSNTIKEEGATDKMSKVETYTAKRSVEDIINPSTLSKTYKDGELIFKIRKA